MINRFNLSHWYCRFACVRYQLINMRMNRYFKVREKEEEKILLKCVKTAKLFHCSAQQKLRWLKILFPPASSVTGEKKLNPLFSFLLFRLNCFSKIISLLKRTFQVCFVPAEQKSQPSLLHGFPYRSEVNHSLICLKSSEENQIFLV